MWEGSGSARGSEGRPRGAGGSITAARLWRALKAVAQLWRAARRRQRGYGGRGVGGGSATPVGGEEAAARLRRAGRMRQRGYGGQGGGCSAVLKGGEEALNRRDAFPV